MGQEIEISSSTGYKYTSPKINSTLKKDLANYWKTATQLNILFMLSLAIGRILSMMTDGVPTSGYIFGLMAELTIGLFSIYQLSRFEK